VLAGSGSSIFELGNGNDRFNAARDVINSEITGQEGNDTVRIGGNASGSFVDTGDGNDQFIVSRSSTGLDVVMGEGNDTALFLGALTAEIHNNVQNIVDLGNGNDLGSFIGGVQGSSAGYQIHLGDGNDTAVFGPSSSSDHFTLSTGTGTDNIKLGRNTSNATLDLGWDQGGASASGDLVVLGVGATLTDSQIRSGQSNDTLRFAGTILNTDLDLGWGNSLVEVDAVAGFGTSGTTSWNLGSGNDTLIFDELSFISELNALGAGIINLGTGSDELHLLGSGYDLEFDLGDDNGADTVFFNTDWSEPDKGWGYAGLTISNFGEDDVLVIGDEFYAYQDVNANHGDFELGTFLSLNSVLFK
jgi:hypothetical protein